MAIEIVASQMVRWQVRRTPTFRSVSTPDMEVLLG